MPQAPSPLANEVAEEREDLEDMLQSKGWHVFESYVAKEWQGIGYYVRMNGVLTSPKPEEAILIHKCSKEIVATMMWPKRRVAELTEAKS